MPSSATAAAVAVVAAALGARYASTLPSFFTSSSHTQSAYDVLDPRRLECHPFLPPVFVETPPSVEHPAIQAAAKALEDQLSSRFAVGDINSLSVAVITSGGAVYEQNFGVIRGNESEASPRTTSHSSYRIASVSKIFIAYEAFILEQKKRLSWDDRVDKHLPLFKPRFDGFKSAEPVPTLDESPITLFDLASHTSGLGRDWPPGTVANWPYDLVGGGPPPTNGLPFPSHESLYDAIARHRLTSPPAAYPAYSNTGTGVLGLALVAANRAAGGSKEPSNYADLMQRDVFGPLGMNGTHFLTIEENKHLVVVPSLAPEVADQDFLDAMNPAGGQFSSLSDMIKFTQAVLNPRSPPNLISSHSAWKWLRPVHTFEEDDWTEIGLTWEIIKQPDSHGRARKIYWKLGAMAGYHAAVAIHPGTSYGITILMAGHYPDAAKLAYDAFATFQPAFDTALEDAARTLYGGLWSAPDGHGSASIIVERGTLWLQHMTLSGVNVLERLFAPGRLPLRYSGRRDELRIDTGFPGPYNGARHMGCYPYWNGQDLWGVRSGAAINVLTFEGDGEARRMVVPALGITLVRKGT